jgi:hypothetical protein
MPLLHGQKGRVKTATDVQEDASLYEAFFDLKSMSAMASFLNSDEKNPRFLALPWQYSGAQANGKAIYVLGLNLFSLFHRVEFRWAVSP